MKYTIVVLLVASLFGVTAFSQQQTGPRQLVIGKDPRKDSTSTSLPPSGHPTGELSKPPTGNSRPKPPKSHQPASKPGNIETTDTKPPSYINYLEYKVFIPNGPWEKEVALTQTTFPVGSPIKFKFVSPINGYLYIFTIHKGKSTMIFPSNKMNSGKNFISAGIVFDYPTSDFRKPGQSYGWLKMSEPGVSYEEIYALVTESPLLSIPTLDTSENGLYPVNECTWQVVKWICEQNGNKPLCFNNNTQIAKISKEPGTRPLPEDSDELPDQQNMVGVKVILKH